MDPSENIITMATADRWAAHGFQVAASWLVEADCGFSLSGICHCALRSSTAVVPGSPTCRELWPIRAQRRGPFQRPVRSRLVILCTQLSTGWSEVLYQLPSSAASPTSPPTVSSFRWTGEQQVFYSHPLQSESRKTRGDDVIIWVQVWRWRVCIAAVASLPKWRC